MGTPTLAFLVPRSRTSDFKPSAEIELRDGLASAGREFTLGIGRSPRVALLRSGLADAFRGVMLERVDERSIARASLLDGRGALTLGIVLRGREAVADDDGRCDDIPRSGETELRVGDLEGVDAEDRSGRAVDALGRGRWLEFDLAEAAARSRAACSASARCMLTDEDDRVDALLPRLELERERLLTLGCGLEGGRLTADRLDDEDDDRCAEDGRELDRLLEGLAADRLAEDDRGAERA